jgi:hypothetical protein
MVNQAVSCEQVWHEISNYLDGDVDAALRTAMGEHFGICPRCKSVLEGTRNVVRLYGDERMIELPAGFDQRLEKRLTRGARGGGSRWLTWEAWLVPAAAMALIVGGLWLVNSRTSVQQVKSQHANAGENIPPDLAVVVAQGTKVFHVPGCIFIHDKDNLRKLTAKEALKEGFTPCPRCLKKYLEATAAVDGLPDADDDDDQIRTDPVRVGSAHVRPARVNEVRGNRE